MKVNSQNERGYKIVKTKYKVLDESFVLNMPTLLVD